MNPGTLFVVATPIGNLADLTFRAREVLEKADGIACEDTRHSSILLAHYGIKKPLISFHSHSGQTKVEKVREALLAGQSLALISDAGTPGISDPGYVLIKDALESGIAVVPIPGACAAITALSAAGLPTDKFLYLGFLPIKKGRQTLLKSLKETPYTIVFYESPHRLVKTLAELPTYFEADRPVVVAKELTKLYETFFRGTAKTIAEKIPENQRKGEFVILIGPPQRGRA